MDSLELNNLINNVINSPGMIILNQPYSWDVFNYIQLKIINSAKKCIIVSFINGTMSDRLSTIDKILKIIDSMQINIEFDDVSKDKLAYLMLNIPGFIECLEQDYEESIETAFESFVKQNNSIKEIILKLNHIE